MTGRTPHNPNLVAVWRTETCTEEGQLLPGAQEVGEKRMAKAENRGAFRVVKVFHMLLQGWKDDIPHLPKPQKLTTQRASLTVIHS